MGKLTVEHIDYIAEAMEFKLDSEWEDYERRTPEYEKAHEYTQNIIYILSELLEG